MTPELLLSLTQAATGWPIPDRLLRYAAITNYSSCSHRAEKGYRYCTNCCSVALPTGRQRHRRETELKNIFCIVFTIVITNMIRITVNRTTYGVTYVYRRYIYKNKKLKVGQYSDEEVWFCTGEKDRRTNCSFHQSNRKIVMIAALLAQL